MKSAHWAREPEGGVLHAFPLPLVGGAQGDARVNVPACGAVFLRREDVSSPAHNDMPKCEACLARAVDVSADRRCA
jgi:hypothetical protein